MKKCTPLAVMTREGKDSPQLKVINHKWPFFRTKKIHLFFYIKWDSFHKKQALKPLRSYDALQKLNTGCFCSIS